MSQMKTTWNHPRKRRALFAFVVGCAYFLGLCAACWFNAENKSPLMPFIFFSAIFVAFTGHRAFFCSDEWFVLKGEHEEKDWLEHHPRIHFILFLIPLMVLACFWAKDILHFFQKL